MFTDKSIAIKVLIEFILRSGDIDAKVTNLDTQKAAQEGIKLHQKFQHAQEQEYQVEVALAIDELIAGENFIFSGRADGILHVDDTVVIDEIKTGDHAFDHLPRAKKEMYWNQVKCYGFIYGLQNDVSEMTLRLIYINREDKKETIEEQVFRFEDLEQFWNDLIDAFETWVILNKEWLAKRNDSCDALAFPYDGYRTGQRELSVATYQSIQREEHLFVEAPTGIGKTISTLFPALKAMANGKIEKIFYLTAKTITQQVALETLKELDAQGLDAKIVIITSKDKSCFLEKRNCTPEACPFADGYYSRVNEAMKDMLAHENIFDKETIDVYAKKYTLCPFELALDISLWCDVIICDYNYLFDPLVFLRRFFQREQENFVFLVDEAHNLVSRSKDMYSASLSGNQVLALLETMKESDAKLTEQLNHVLNDLDGLKEQIGGLAEYENKLPLETLNQQLFYFTRFIKKWLPQNQGHPKLEEILSFYFEVNTYLKISDLYNEQYTTYISNKEDFVIKQFCLDPAEFLADMLDKGLSSIFFSASLTPLPYYQEVLGGKFIESNCYLLPSPFPEAHQYIVQLPFIQTTYHKRTQSLASVVVNLKVMLDAKIGNYMVFFPSYQYMNDAYRVFESTYPDVRVQRQESQMSEFDRVQVLDEFGENPQEAFLYFCVMGGVFSEGIDMPGNRISGAAVVSVGLPQMNFENNLLNSYYDEKHQAGFVYTYQIPGMNKVIQAAGRVIRGMNDKGVVLLMDERFSRTNYQQLFPHHWRNTTYAQSADDLDKKLSTFWDEFPDY